VSSAARSPAFGSPELRGPGFYALLELRLERAELSIRRLELLGALEDLGFHRHGPRAEPDELGDVFDAVDDVADLAVFIQHG
jgi:hypothetical protein